MTISRPTAASHIPAADADGDAIMQVRTLLMATVAVMMTVGSAEAGWHEFWDRVHLDFHRNNSWPQPFSSVDRRATCAPFNAMVASGWRRQNTLGLHYFDRETQALNEAGKRRLHWIMSNSPEQHRTVYVAESHVQDQSERRIDSVQTALAQQLPGQSLPAVINKYYHLW